MHGLRGENYVYLGWLEGKPKRWFAGCTTFSIHVWRENLRELFEKTPFYPLKCCEVHREDHGGQEWSIIRAWKWSFMRFEQRRKWRRKQSTWSDIVKCGTNPLKKGFDPIMLVRSTRAFWRGIQSMDVGIDPRELCGEGSDPWTLEPIEPLCKEKVSDPIWGWNRSGHGDGEGSDPILCRFDPPLHWIGSLYVRIDVLRG